ncbi:MAG: sigma-70 family RNA polymerase sigma factor [Pseudomonadota bacterium]
MTARPYDIVASEFCDERHDLVALARALVGHDDIAEDIVQESWLRWQRHDYPTNHAKPIFVRIIKNLAADWHRHRAIEARNYRIHAMLRGDTPDTERIVVARQQLRLVIEALRGLPEQNLEAFRLHRMEGMAFADIGAQLGISKAGAHRLVAQALTKIVLHLEA